MMEYPSSSSRPEPQLLASPRRRQHQLAALEAMRRRNDDLAAIPSRSSPIDCGPTAGEGREEDLNSGDRDKGRVGGAAVAGMVWHAAVAKHLTTGLHAAVREEARAGEEGLHIVVAGGDGNASPLLAITEEGAAASQKETRPAPPLSLAPSPNNSINSSHTTAQSSAVGEGGDGGNGGSREEKDATAVAAAAPPEEGTAAAAVAYYSEDYHRPNRHRTALDSVLLVPPTTSSNASSSQFQPPPRLPTVDTEVVGAAAARDFFATASPADAISSYFGNADYYTYDCERCWGGGGTEAATKAVSESEAPPPAQPVLKNTSSSGSASAAPQFRHNHRCLTCSPRTSSLVNTVGGGAAGQAVPTTNPSGSSIDWSTAHWGRVPFLANLRHLSDLSGFDVAPHVRVRLPSPQRQTDQTPSGTAPPTNRGDDGVGESPAAVHHLPRPPPRIHSKQSTVVGAADKNDDKKEIDWPEKEESEAPPTDVEVAVLIGVSSEDISIAADNIASEVSLRKEQKEEPPAAADAESGETVDSTVDGSLPPRRGSRPRPASAVSISIAVRPSPAPSPSPPPAPTADTIVDGGVVSLTSSSPPSRQRVGRCTSLLDSHPLLAANYE